MYYIPFLFSELCADKAEINKRNERKCIFICIAHKKVFYTFSFSVLYEHEKYTEIKDFFFFFNDFLYRLLFY